MELKNKKHQRFVENYLTNGRNGQEAYKLVYPRVTDDNVAKAAASRLLTDVNVRKYLDTQENKITEKFQITRESMANLLLDCIEDCKEAGDRRNLVSAVTVLNKMFGLESSQKIEVEAKGLIINYIQPKK